MKPPPNFDTKAVAEVLAKYNPKLWQRCYPRVYIEPSSCGKYYSAKMLAAQLMATALRVKQEGLGGESQIVELLWASRLASLSVPLYWVGHDMAQAIQQTVPLVEFDWKKTHLPFEAMVFMVPKGVLLHEEDGEAVFVSFIRVKKDETITNFSSFGPNFFDIGEDAFSCFVYTSHEALLHWTYAKDDGKVNLAELDKLVQEFAQRNHSTYSLWSATLTDADNRFMVRVCHFIFGILLLMLTRPDQITPAVFHKKVKKNFSLSKEFWLPNVLGLRYHLKHENQGGVHASPRLHWVRGAYKEQPYGEKHLLRKQIWIEPYLRGS